MDSDPTDFRAMVRPVGPQPLSASCTTSPTPSAEPFRTKTIPYPFGFLHHLPNPFGFGLRARSHCGRDCVRQAPSLGGSG